MFTFIKNMTRFQKRLVILSLDVCLMLLSLYLAFGLRGSSIWPIEVMREYAAFIPIVLIVGTLVSLTLGIPSIKLISYENRAMMRTLTYAGLVTIASFVTGAIIGINPGKGVMISFGLFFFLLCMSSRLVSLQILQWIYAKKGDRSPVIIYGAGSAGVQLLGALKQSETLYPIAFVDDNSSLQNVMVAGLAVHHPNKLNKFIKDKKISRVLLAMPSLSRARQNQIAQRLKSLGVQVQTLPSFTEIIEGNELVSALKPISPSDILERSHLESDIPGISDAYADKIILVTGAGGSIGSELCRQLLECKAKKVIILDHSEAALYAIDIELRDLNELHDTEIINCLGSVTNAIYMKQVLKKHNIEIILHAAAYKHVPLVEDNKIIGLSNNVFGTKILADAALESNVQKFILVSTDKAVRPTNVMGASKRLAELIIQDLATRSKTTRFSMVRFGNVLNSSGSVIPLFRNQILKGGPVTVTHQDVMRYFMTIPEAARLVLIAGSFSRGGDVFVLDMGKPVSILNLARRVIQMSGYSVKDEENPLGDIAIEITGLRPGEKLYEELLIGADQLTTPHPKILRAQEEYLSEIEVANILRELRKVIEHDDDEMAVILIRNWVSEFQLHILDVNPKNQERDILQ